MAGKKQQQVKQQESHSLPYNTKVQLIAHRIQVSTKMLNQTRRSILLIKKEDIVGPTEAIGKEVLIINQL